MKYQLLNEGEVIQQGDEWYNDDPSLWTPLWIACEGKEIGIYLDGSTPHRRPVQSWQPISTAPKDGTAILVGWWKELTDWDREKKVHIHRDWEWNVTVVQNYNDGDGWQLVEGGAYACDYILDKPLTHWQPLPAPPEPTRKEDEV